MFKNISSTLFIMVIAMLSSFAATILLGRNLSESDFGEFTLLKQILLIGATVAVFGLDYSYIKNYAKLKNISMGTHLLTLSIFSFVSLFFVIVLRFVYDISPIKLTYVYLGVLAGAINFYIAAIQRIKNRFLLAQLFAHGWKILFLILIGLLLYSDIEISSSTIYPVFTISLFIGSTFIIRYLFNNNNEQSSKLEVKNYLTFGLMFWLINSTGLISGGIDKLVIPLLYGSDTLGIYAAVSFVFVISLTMVGSAIGYVIFPKISAGQPIDVKKWSFIVISICIIAILIYQAIGLEIVSLIFSGKYDLYVTTKLILAFSVLGSLQIIHTILHFIISAKGEKHELMQYWFLTIGFIMVFITLLYFGQGQQDSLLLRIASIVMITRVVKIIAMALFLKHILHKTIKPDSALSELDLAEIQ